jgi:alkanesulfonate monooxygenase SsuD/methylene tetrahydromethanopterin reductase-like flavin-dependent oxidoreductase (luciferase family)
LQHAKDARLSDRNDRNDRKAGHPVKVGTMIEPRLPGAVEFAAAVERIGVDSLWLPEVWGYDALTGLAYLAAKTSTVELGTFVVQLGSRSPRCSRRPH